MAPATPCDAPGDQEYLRALKHRVLPAARSVHASAGEPRHLPTGIPRQKMDVQDSAWIASRVHRIARRQTRTTFRASNAAAPRQPGAVGRPEERDHPL